MRAFAEAMEDDQVTETLNVEIIDEKMNNI